MGMKQVVKKFVVMFGAVAMTLMLFMAPSSALPVQAADYGESEIQPLKDDIEYVYKKENGKIYKRLYNFSTCNWIGDWIYVRDDPNA